MEEPRLKPAPGKRSSDRIGLLLINLPWLFVLLVLWWLAS